MEDRSVRDRNMNKMSVCFFFFFKQKTAYEITRWLEFRRVLFRSLCCEFLQRIPELETLTGFIAATVDTLALAAEDSDKQAAAQRFIALSLPAVNDLHHAVSLIWHEILIQYKKLAHVPQLYRYEFCAFGVSPKPEHQFCFYWLHLPWVFTSELARLTKTNN